MDAAYAREYGRAQLTEAVRTYGRVTNSALVADVDTVFRRLLAATGAPHQPVTWAVVGDTSMNATAHPGGVVVVNLGLLTTSQALAADQPTVGARRARYLAFVAAVLGHELGHVALGHPDSALARAFRARASRTDEAAVPNRNPDDRTLRAVLADTGMLGAARASRAVELAADRYGAVLLLRAGWTMQDAIDLFRRMEPEDRAGHSLRELSWFRDHPRGIVREAELEHLRADLRRDQALFDDALLLVDHGVLLDSAVAMLDRVIVDFPDLPAARHARAAALQLWWINTRSTRALRVQSLAPTYTASFAETVRGSGDADPLLARARAAYRDAARLDAHPYTLVNLAVLDAYADDRVAARAHADAALRAMPADTAVLINRGVVLFLLGDYAAAREVFAALARGANAPPLVHYNLAQALLALGDSGRARALLERYAGEGRTPAWTDEAQRTLARLGARPNIGALAATATPVGEHAPAVAGVQFGTTRAGVVAALGQPDGEEVHAGQGTVLHYGGRGVTVVVAVERGVVLIALQRPEAGTIDGIAVNDPIDRAVARWGRPRVGDDGTLLFLRGTYLIAARVLDASIGLLAVSSWPLPPGRGP